MGGGKSSFSPESVMMEVRQPHMSSKELTSLVLEVRFMF